MYTKCTQHTKRAELKHKGCFELLIFIHFADYHPSAIWRFVLIVFA